MYNWSRETFNTTEVDLLNKELKYCLSSRNRDTKSLLVDVETNVRFATSEFKTSVRTDLKHELDEEKRFTSTIAIK